MVLAGKDKERPPAKAEGVGLSFQIIGLGRFFSFGS
mgnify:CR=1 FL=1